MTGVAVASSSQLAADAGAAVAHAGGNAVDAAVAAAFASFVAEPTINYGRPLDEAEPADPDPSNTVVDPETATFLVDPSEPAPHQRRRTRMRDGSTGL